MKYSSIREGYEYCTKKSLNLFFFFLLLQALYLGRLSLVPRLSHFLSSHIITNKKLYSKSVCEIQLIALLRKEKACTRNHVRTALEI